jgi:AcrR family transcriptional regulator
MFRLLVLEVFSGIRCAVTTLKACDICVPPEDGIQNRQYTHLKRCEISLSIQSNPRSVPTDWRSPPPSSRPFRRSLLPSLPTINSRTVSRRGGKDFKKLMVAMASHPFITAFVIIARIGAVNTCEFIQEERAPEARRSCARLPAYINKKKADVNSLISIPMQHRIGERRRILEVGTTMRDRSSTHKRVLEAAYELFYRHGYARVSVDQIGDRAGVTKRTLYDHFRSKDELLAAVLEIQNEIAVAHFEKWKLCEAPDIPEMVDRLFADVALWSESRRFTATGFTRIVMELADLPGHPARKIASRHKAALESWFEREFERRKIRSPEIHAREIVLLIEGATALMLVHANRDYAAAAAEAAKSLLRSSHSFPGDRAVSKTGSHLKASQQRAD